MVAHPSRIRDVFLAAADLPPADRPAHLANACGPDPSLWAAVDRLLAAHDHPDRFLDRPPVLFDYTVGAAGADSRTPIHTVSGANTDDSPGRSADHTPAPARPVPPTLGGYRIERLLGEGGMGAVYLAHDDRLGRSVALKTMRPDVAAAPGTAARFIREARAAAQVAHDNVIPIWQVGEDAGVPFIAMPVLDGEPLDRVLRRHPVCSVGLVFKVGREVAQGLAAAHARGLVHRDVKPANIWVEGDPAGADLAARFRRVKVLDFGLARPAAGAHLTADGTVVGTPAYMSPEQARGEPLDARTDLFSLGVVLYRMATGEQPFRGGTAYAVLSSLANDTPAPPAAKNLVVPAALSGLILRLLAKDPDDRPASAAAVAVELREIAARLHAARRGPAAPPAAVPPAEATTLTAVPLPEPAAAARKVRPRGRRLWAAAGFAAAVVLAVGGIVIKIKGQDGKVTTVEVPEGSTVQVDPKGGAVITPPGDGQAPPQPGTPTAAPPPPPPPPRPPVDAKRTLIEWVLSNGGQVTIRVGDQSKRGVKLTDLPPGPFGVTHVWWSDCLGRVTDKDLPQLTGLTELEWLYLPGAALTEEGAKRIASMTWLKMLNLDDTGLTDAGLAHFAGHRALSTLSLTRTAVTDKGLLHLRGMPNLGRLILTKTKVSDAGLAHLTTLPQLVNLYLNETDITDVGLVHVAKLKGLTYLNLDGTAVTDAGLDHLARLTKLDSLSLKGTEMTAAGVAKLQKALPKCKITFGPVK